MCNKQQDKIKWVFPVGKEATTKEEMRLLLRDSYKKVMKQYRKRKAQDYLKYE